ncbi:hypothetical protein RFI_39670, partial [Reticulomyxa filosa]
MLQFETDEEEKVKLDNISLEDCYNKHWISLLNKEETVNKFICLLCKQVAYNAVELSCREHENMEEKCPIEQHDSCEYSKNRLAQQEISSLIVMCPRQYQMTHGVEHKATHIGTMEDDEGSNVNEYNLSQKQGCNYRGTIKGLKEHLETSCRLKPVYCCFQKFGCDTLLFERTQSEHCMLHMQAHLLLVDNHIRSLQQKMLEKDDHIQHLQTQLQMQQ